jgi:hypothetical protein
MQIGLSGIQENVREFAPHQLRFLLDLPQLIRGNVVQMYRCRDGQINPGWRVLRNGARPPNPRSR